MKRIYLLLIVLLSGAACSSFGANPALETAVAENAILQTQIVDIRATATVEADRMMITVEHAMTAEREVNVANQRLQATLVARGTSVDFIAQTMPQPDQATEQPLTAPTLDASMFITPGANNPAPQVADFVTPLSDTGAAQLTPSPVPVVENAGPALLNITTSTGVGANDCPQGITSTFDSSSTEIYVTAVASDIQPGTNILSRWLREGQEQITFDFTPNFAIDGGCIWFFITPADVAFTPGTWSVQLEINGTISGDPATFSIVGEDPAAIE